MHEFEANKVTLQTIRSQQSPRAKVASQYQQLEKQSEEHTQGDTNISKLSVITGHERMGESDHMCMYGKWPQEACFIGHDRRTVRHGFIAAKEADPVVQISGLPPERLLLWVPFSNGLTNTYIILSGRKL